MEISLAFAIFFSFQSLLSCKEFCCTCTVHIAMFLQSISKLSTIWNNYCKMQITEIFLSIDYSLIFFCWSCIERWLKAKGGNDKCPQCNAPARKKDIRNIYTKAVKSIDTTERDRALADLEKEKEARQKAEEREARALLQYQLVKAECEKIVTQLKKQEQLVFSLQRER